LSFENGDELKYQIATCSGGRESRWGCQRISRLPGKSRDRKREIDFIRNERIIEK
jgi:hypothetical protein